MKKGYIFLAFLLLAILSVSVVSAGLFDNNSNNIDVTNLQINSEGYGMYEVTCNLVANKNFDYLEMIVVFYDDSGAIIHKDPLVWNMNDVPDGQTISVSGTAYITNDQKPARAEVYIVDSALDQDLEDAIFHQTVTM